MRDSRMAEHCVCLELAMHPIEACICNHRLICNVQVTHIICNVSRCLAIYYFVDGRLAETYVAELTRFCTYADSTWGVVLMAAMQKVWGVVLVGMFGTGFNIGW